MAASKTKRAETVQLGAVQVDEKGLLDRLVNLQRSIKAWARERRLWGDTWFHMPLEYHQDRPRSGTAIYLSTEGPLYHVLNSPGRSYEAKRQEFSTFLKRQGFFFDQHTHIDLAIYPSSDHLAEQYRALYSWQWLQHLMERRAVDLHAEVFEFIAKDPDTLNQFSWRQYEEFLDSVFRNQGFFTRLGPGTNDGGVDIRLYQSATVPELVTLVQAKRWRTRPIGLDEVAALLGIMVEQRAQRGVLVTTSRFQPKAQSFARSIQQRIDLPGIDLVDSTQVRGWCADIAKLLEAYFAGGDTQPPLVSNIPPGPLTGKVVIASHGYNMSGNKFGVIEADLPHEVVIRMLRGKMIEGDGQRGREVPDFDDNRGLRLVAFKEVGKSGQYFWSDPYHFSLWDGTPQWFDHCD